MWLLVQRIAGRRPRRWLEARQADLLPVEYFHVVFTLPAPISAIAWYNKRVIYGLLFDIAADTLRTIAADPRHLGARIGATLVLHTWGSALTHHPHVHGIVPGGGLSPDGERWIACRPGFFLPVRVLSRLFRRLLPRGSSQRVHQPGDLQFFGESRRARDPATFARWLAPLRTCEWVVYAKRPFAGPKAVLEYLSATRTASPSPTAPASPSMSAACTFRWKDYRAKGRTRYKTMTLEAGEFMRRFLLHVLPGGFHRIRHYGLLANCHRTAKLASCRGCWSAPSTRDGRWDGGERRRAKTEIPACPCCGGPMLIIERLPGPSSRRSYPARKPDGW